MIYIILKVQYAIFWGAEVEGKFLSICYAANDEEHPLGGEGKFQYI